ncbi:MAG: serine/threonine protein kinase [Myxococcales bacterium]|nr:serine/threonine protein kinase [Myxococcales bacterium]
MADLPIDPTQPSRAPRGVSAAETLMGSNTQGSAEPSGRLPRGAMVGRYIVLDLRGRGGMGMVYAAYDPELDRKVAVKLLLPGRDQALGARLRLQREAQAIARLSHPNVVAIHDVGMMGDQVFIAMEFVEGRDLSRWLTAQERSLDEILDCFLQAGTGLAAAHAAGLVHRDFKPENVLVGVDGRARVVDFGLVRQDDSLMLSSMSRDDPAVLEVSQRQLAAADLQLTDAGSVMGTPAYMSPEQFMGQGGDAASDQFSFCVSLYEGLYGERPFPGSDMVELSHAVCQGEIRGPPATSRVPGRIRRVLVRGLSVDPAARYAGMHALLAALRKAHAPRRRWWIAPVALGLGGVGAAVMWPRAEPDDGCTGDDRVEVLWGPSRRAALAQAFARSEQSFADDTWARVQAQLDHRLERWVAIEHQVCEEGAGLDPAAVAEDPRRRCLEERLAETSDLLSIFEQADRRTVLGAVQMVHGLSPVDDCTRFDGADVSPVPGDPTLAAQVQALRSELRHWRMQTSARGHTDATTATLTDLAVRGETLGYEPLVAELLEAQSSRAQDEGDLEQAVALGNRAFEAALGCRHDHLAFEVATDLLFWYGVDRREPEAAHRWGRLAQALQRRLGTEPKRELQLLSNLASVHAIYGEDDRARALYDEALALVRRLDAPIPLATVLNNIGSYHAERGRLVLARDYLEEAARLNDELLGPDHPSSLRTRANLGIIAVIDGRPEDGLHALERLLPRQEAVVGPESPDVSRTLESMASALARLGRYEDALAMRRRVLDIRRAAYGPRGRPTLAAQVNLASTMISAGRYEDALALLDAMGPDVDALSEQEVSLRVDRHVNLSEALTGLGLGSAADGPDADADPDPDPDALARAHDHAQQALALCERSERCSPPKQAEVRLNVGWTALRDHDRAAARAIFESLMGQPPSSVPLWVMIDASRGLASTMLDDDREGALALARRTLSELDLDMDRSDRSDRTALARLEELRRWLAHPDPLGRSNDDAAG